MVAADARGGTLDEFLAVLGTSSRDNLTEYAHGIAERALADQSPWGGPIVKFASGVWHDAGRTLKPAYQDAAVASYKAETRTVDFRNKPDEARDEINRWAAAATNNLIQSILGASSLATVWRRR